MGINAVWGPPQSGKTTLAIDLAFALSMQGQSVCLISPELYSELAARLNIQIVPEKSLNAALKKKESLKQIVHTADDLLYVLAVPFDNDAFGEDMPEETAKTILDQADNLFDVVIVDCPSHTGSVLAAWALSISETVFLMSGSHSASVLWNNAFRKAVSTVRDKTIYVCAEANDSFDYRTLHSLLNVEPDVWLPHFPNAAIVQMLKRTLYQHSSKHGKAYTKAIDQICSLLNGEEDDEE